MKFSRLLAPSGTFTRIGPGLWLATRIPVDPYYLVKIRKGSRLRPPKVSSREEKEPRLCMHILDAIRWIEVEFCGMDQGTFFPNPVVWGGVIPHFSLA